jgi:hypothetical protein
MTLVPELFVRRLNKPKGLPLNVRDVSVTGDGQTDDYAALNEAVRSAGATGTLYFPAGTYVVGTNLTIPACCIFAFGAKLKPSSGVTVTLSGPVETAPGESVIATGTAGTVSITGYQGAVSITEYNNSLPEAVAAIGALKATLVVDVVVTLTSTLTVPSNITLLFEGAGMITLGTGVRLFINGPVQANRLQHIFSCTLFANPITASISGNALTITAVTSNTVAPGQIVTGAGLRSGLSIFQQYGTDGVGTYALCGYNGVVVSQAMSLISSPVIFGDGVVEEVYPAWFGAVNDGVTDCSTALNLSSYSQPWGGKIKIPAGGYVVTSPTYLYPGMVVEGDGSNNDYSGSPPSAQISTMATIFVAADNVTAFLMSDRCNQVNIRNVVFATQNPPYLNNGDYAPFGTNRKAIVYDGHAPQGIFGGVIDGCLFFGFEQAILANDSWALVGDGYAPSTYFWSGTTVNATSIVQGVAYEIATVGSTNWAAITGTLLSGVTGTVGCRFLPNATTPTGSGTAHQMPRYYDWQINPLQVRNCYFIGNAYGVFFNTNNADAWRIIDCLLYMPPNSSGVHLNRCGFLKLESCFAFGATVSGTEFVKMVGDGAESLDAVTLDNCQAENCAHFLVYASGSGVGVPPAINVKNCTHQIAADVYLGSPCEYNSTNNHIMSDIYVDSVNVRINTINDKYQFKNYVSGPTWSITIASGDANSIYTYLPGQNPSSTFSGPIFNGSAYYTLTGTAAPSGSVTPTRVGQLFLNTSSSVFYLSTGLLNTDWVAIN